MELQQEGYLVLIVYNPRGLQRLHTVVYDGLTCGVYYADDNLDGPAIIDNIKASDQEVVV